MKCEDLRESQATGRSSCKVCRENKEECTFDAPVKKRGPRPGWRLRGRSTSPSREPKPSSSATSSARPIQPSGETQHPNRNRGSSPSVGANDQLPTDTRDSSPSPDTTKRPAKGTYLGLSTGLVDELLAVYFTHVHNGWPLIYKPLFHIQSTSKPLLLAMLAIASCVAPPELQSNVDSDKLFHMAERSMHHCRMESRIDLIQSLILLSLRQTGCGDKHMAFSYAGRACTMALNLGLNLAPAHAESPTECEIRSRVYWNCYVLDKTLAEETGRSFLLPYRRSSTPLPSMNEADEFETWPPLPTSSMPPPRSVRHIVPRRGNVMSCFVWTCQLGMIVEDILDMDQPGPPAGTDPRFVDSPLSEREDLVHRAEQLSARLDAWRAALPRNLDVDPYSNLSPMPHHAVGVSWYYTAQILLLSRFINRRSLRYPPSEAETEFSKRAHHTCSQAAEYVVDLLGHLDAHKLLSHVSADIIHILSLATLFEAFDSSDADPARAERAKMKFTQCCVWLRDCSAAWPAASAHKLFFEGLIQGGLKLSAADEGSALDLSPENATSPPLPEGLRAVGRNLSHSERDLPRVSLPPLGISNLFQLPQFYWNHLTNAAGAPSGPNLDMTLLSPEAANVLLPDWHQTPSTYSGRDSFGVDAFNFAQPSDAHSAPSTGGNVSWTTPTGTTTMDHGQSQGQHQNHTQSQTQSQGHNQSQSHNQTHGNDAQMMQQPGNMGSSSDQAAIYSALMSFMVEAAKSH